MRILGKSVLTILFIPLFLIFLATTSIKFQLLNPNFYINSFSQHNVYQETSDDIKTLIKQNSKNEIQTQNSELNTYLSLLSPENLQDFTQNNIKNIFKFLNKQTKELIVYLPLDKIPASVLPFGFLLKGNEVPLSTLLAYFGRPGATIDPILLQRAQLITTASLLLWILSLALLCLIIFTQIRITSKGKRLVSPGLSLFLSGLISIGVVGIVSLMKVDILKQWSTSTEPSQILFGPIVSALVSSITNLWLYIGAATITVGAILFFVKRPKPSKS